MQVRVLPGGPLEIKMNNYYRCQNCNFHFDEAFDKSYHCLCSISNYSYYFNEIKVLSLRLESELFIRIRLDFKNDQSILFGNSKQTLLPFVITPENLENLENLINYL